MYWGFFASDCGVNGALKKASNGISWTVCYVSRCDGTEDSPSAGSLLGASLFAEASIGAFIDFVHDVVMENGGFVSSTSESCSIFRELSPEVFLTGPEGGNFFEWACVVPRNPIEVGSTQAQLSAFVEIT